jgi:hypothetical protein
MEQVAYYSKITQAHFAYVHQVIVRITEAEFNELCDKLKLERMPYDGADVDQHYIVYGIRKEN